MQQRSSLNSKRGRRYRATAPTQLSREPTFILWITKQASLHKANFMRPILAPASWNLRSTQQLDDIILLMRAESSNKQKEARNSSQPLHNTRFPLQPAIVLKSRGQQRGDLGEVVRLKKRCVTNYSAASGGSPSRKASRTSTLITALQRVQLCRLTFDSYQKKKRLMILAL